MVRQHFIDQFIGHEFAELQWLDGPMKEIAPDFRVLRFAPGPNFQLWVYVSLGASTLSAGAERFEFTIFSPYESSRFVELITMTAHYHKSHNLSIGHTVPLGEPWISGSQCHAYLVSRPYPLGPEFEICDTTCGHLHALWLLPITNKERDFKIANGLESLEARFEDAKLEYWDFKRISVV
jgi:hypothetical protein